jgi:transcriptional regulator with XRE-family HTH domain
MQERTGIDSANLSRIENGLVPNPTVETLARYAEALNRELVLSLRAPAATV